MDVHSKPIQERIDWLFDIAQRYSVDFTSPETYLARQRYLAVHPTNIVALKCMDGRINIPVATNTPPGIIHPFRNLGGMFNLGWPHLNEVLAHHVRDIVHTGRQVLVLITYHFSKGDPHRGCAGFNYDTEAAIAHTHAIKEQVEFVFGHGHGTVYPVVCGFETDDDALILHGRDGAQLDLAELTPDKADTLLPWLAALFPDMPGQMREDLLPLLKGNLEHTAHVRQLNRTLDIQHREWMICVGRGFDFLHTPNLALIIGPYSPNLADPIRKAASIILNNMQTGRIPDDGFLLLASSPYDEVGMDRARAEMKARFMSEFTAQVIKTEFPALAGRMHQRTAVLNSHSRALELTGI
ncbi:MAG: hypothetical protein AB1831_13955 [Pseudomonadota bacterium]